MPIRVLPIQLANQIAAGEVVERPASIIKELVENSLDAGSTKIEIELEDGGCKLIRIKDNGCGIPKEELGLALTRHATSKIATLDDLNEILSLGFRGEALASISSVSRLTLSSKPELQSEGWSVYAEGRDMDPILKPIAHTQGTTVEVLDLFYNTPARKRFLKSDKTELQHVMDVIKRIALAYPNVSITMSHNGKSLLSYKTQSDEIKWLKSICGAKFSDSAIKVELEHDDLKLTGWLSFESSDPIHYFYVNGRMIKNRVIHHAIKQAESQFNSLSQTDNSLSYLLYLTMDPQQVDVNVHPAKHEVRFHNARLVHDFIHYAISSYLSDHKQSQMESVSPEKNQQNSEHSVLKNRSAAGINIYQTHTQLDYSEADKSETKTESIRAPSLTKSTQLSSNSYDNRGQYTSSKYQMKETAQHNKAESLFYSLIPKRDNPHSIQSHSINHQEQVIHSEIAISEHEGLGRVVALVNSEFALLENHTHRIGEGGNLSRFSLLSIFQLECVVFEIKIKHRLYSSEQLIVPLSIKLEKEEKTWLQDHLSLFNDSGFEIELKQSKLILNAVPQFLRHLNWEHAMITLIKHLSVNTADPIQFRLMQELKTLFNYYLMKQSSQMNRAYVIQRINEFEQLHLLYGMDDFQINQLSQPVDLTVLLSQFDQGVIVS